MFANRRVRVSRRAVVWWIAAAPTRPQQLNPLGSLTGYYIPTHCPVSLCKPTYPQVIDTDISGTERAKNIGLPYLILTHKNCYQRRQKLCRNATSLAAVYMQVSTSEIRQRHLIVAPDSAMWHKGSNSQQ